MDDQDDDATYQRWLDDSESMPSHELWRKRIYPIATAPVKKSSRVQILNQEEIWKLFKRGMIISSESMNGNTILCSLWNMKIIFENTITTRG
jgi:hypothetical protein